MKTKIFSLPKRKQCGQDDLIDEDKQKISIAQCREILQEEGKELTDEEILKIRNYFYYLAAVGWEEYQYRRQHAKLVNLEEHKITQNEESHYLRTG